MRKSIKIACIVAASLVGAGFLFGLVGLAAMGFDFTKLSTQKFTTNTYKLNEDFTSIKIEKTNSDVRFALATDNVCKVECFESVKTSHTIVVEDNALVIREENHRKWYDYIGINFQEAKTTVYLPQTAYENLYINGSVSDITLSKDFTFQNVEVKVSTGDVTIHAAVENTLSVKTSTGEIEINSVNAVTLNAQTSTGDVNIKDCAAQDLSVKTNTGEVDLERVTATNEMRIVTDTGDVELSACDGGALYIKTDTGDVEGTLLSDKIFLARSDTGKIRVPQTIEGGRCEIETDTGDIKISIIK